jgi:hypothetical protein
MDGFFFCSVFPSPFKIRRLVQFCSDFYVLVQMRKVLQSDKLVLCWKKFHCSFVYSVHCMFPYLFFFFLLWCDKCVVWCYDFILNSTGWSWTCPSYSWKWSQQTPGPSKATPSSKIWITSSTRRGVCEYLAFTDG